MLSVQNLFSKFCMKCHHGLSNIDCFFAFKMETKLSIRTAFAHYRLHIINKYSLHRIKKLTIHQRFISNSSKPIMWYFWYPYINMHVLFSFCIWLSLQMNARKRYILLSKCLWMKICRCMKMLKSVSWPLRRWMPAASFTSSIKPLSFLQLFNKIY